MEEIGGLVKLLAAYGAWAVAALAITALVFKDKKLSKAQAEHLADVKESKDTQTTLTQSVKTLAETQGVVLNAINQKLDAQKITLDSLQSKRR